MTNARGIRSSMANSSESAASPGVALSIGMLVAFLIVVFGFAAAGGAITTANIGAWYTGIAKPELTPANRVFPIVWNFLYFLMGVSAWLVWRTAGSINAAGAALALFTAQLMLNLAWTVLFFGLHNLGGAAVEVLALDLAIVTTIWVFWGTSRLAALLLIPYLAWTLFAAYLTIATWLLNR